MVGFDAFSAAARNLEQLAQQQKWSEIEPKLEELRSLADRIQIPALDSSANNAQGGTSA